MAGGHVGPRAVRGVSERLAELERQGLSRSLRTVTGPQRSRVTLDGREVLLLCSNNYLGLADHPRVREAAARAAAELGAGAGASRLVSGTMEIQRRLERALAEFEGSEDCVLFGSGYLANLGVIGAFAGPDDTIYSDALNHASIIDGCRAARARIVVYPHRDWEWLECALRRNDGAGRRLIVTDSVFSMDGDVAPLDELARLARSHQAVLMVDEAHATGTFGPVGEGAVAHAQLQGRVEVTVGTLSKALGSYGAFVCADRRTVRYLVNCARPLIFSTAPPPASVAAALAALQLLREQPELVDRLHGAARALREGLSEQGFVVADNDTHIVPLVVGDASEAARMCEAALERGVFAQAIRPPTVPAGSSRLRLTAMATHEPQELREAARRLAESARAVGLDPSRIVDPTRIGSPPAPGSKLARVA